jgi:4-hydroxy-tetrahydrodipicolinate synthase
MITGTITALITPFKATQFKAPSSEMAPFKTSLLKNSPLKNAEAIDFVALERMLQFQINNKVDGILVAGSTGEGLLLTDDERANVINFAREVINRRVPLIVGSSCVSTPMAIGQVVQAEELKADAVLSIVPFYVKPTQRGIIQHFIDIHNNSNIPIIVYNNPSRCSVGISVSSVIEVFKQARVVAMKDSDTDISRVTRLKESVKQLTLFSGDDQSLLDYMDHGGDGTVSVTANVAPDLVSLMVNFWKSGNREEARELSRLLLPLSNALFAESNPIPVKYALYKKGLIENELRKPLTKAAPSTAKVVEEALEKIGQ